MADDDEEENKRDLEKLWKGGRAGTLSPLEQLRAWAYRDVMRDRAEPKHGMYTKIAAKVVKVGGGSPTLNSVTDFFSRVDADPAWYPGKVYRKRWGPKPALNAAKRQCTARSAEAMTKSKNPPVRPSTLEHLWRTCVFFYF